MSEGFFSISELSASNTTPPVPRCGICKLYSTCKAPKMKPTGEGRKGVLIVGEAPGKTEDCYIDPITKQKGKQFIGESGQLLRRILKSIDVNLDKDCWKTNAICCRPPDNKMPKNVAQIIDACRPNLMNTIKKYKPHTIILFGATACKSLIPIVWKEKVDDFARWPNWDIPSQKLNAWIGIAYHPAFLLRQKNDLIEMLTRKNLKRIFRHKERPWEKVPNYKREVEIVARPSQAAKILREMICQARPVALDLETLSLKPEEAGTEIICCSVCQNGERTIAYPWNGEAIDATVELIRSNVGKIGANIKFESRWFKHFHNTKVKNWIWDCTLAAHLLDNRGSVTSVKFQSFVQLGMEAYNSEIEPYMRPKNNSRLNRLKELPINDVMTYCGLDSRIEWELYVKQLQAMKAMTKSMEKNKT